MYSENNLQVRSRYLAVIDGFLNQQMQTKF